MESEKKFTYKTTLYCIRGLLSAELATKSIMPPLLIEDLFDEFDEADELVVLARSCIEKKRLRIEKTQVDDGDKKLILKKTRDYSSRLSKVKFRPTDKRLHLEKILSRYSEKIKSEYY
jgi:hypothetical protein